MIRDELLQISGPVGTSYGEFAAREFVIFNNKWGAENGFTRYDQHVHFCMEKPGPLGGWDYYAHDETGGVLAYPCIIAGVHPWSALKVPPWPIKIGEDIGQLVVNYAVRTEATGRRNLAIDAWIIDGSAPSEKAIAAELMVWLDSEYSPTPAGSIIDDSGEFQVWVGGTNWPIVSYVQRKKSSSGSVLLGLLINNYLSRGVLPGDYYLSSVELGNEIWNGSGSTIIDEFSVNWQHKLKIPFVPVSQSE